MSVRNDNSNCLKEVDAPASREWKPEGKHSSAFLSVFFISEPLLESADLSKGVFSLLS